MLLPCCLHQCADIETCMRMQGRMLWQPSAWADATYTHGFVWPKPLNPLLFFLAHQTLFYQAWTPSMYFGLLDFCRDPWAAGSWVAWLAISILLVILVLVRSWLMYAFHGREPDDRRLYKANAGVTISGLEYLFADILELEDAQRLCHAFVQDKLSAASPTNVSCETGNLLAQRSLGCQSRSKNLVGSSKRQLLLTMKVCDEMIANLRGRLAFTCHRVTGEWLSDVTEARDAIHEKLAHLRATEEPPWSERMLKWCHERIEWCHERVECFQDWCQDRFFMTACRAATAICRAQQVHCSRHVGLNNLQVARCYFANLRCPAISVLLQPSC